MEPGFPLISPEILVMNVAVFGGIIDDPCVGEAVTVGPHTTPRPAVKVLTLASFLMRHQVPRNNSGYSATECEEFHPRIRLPRIQTCGLVLVLDYLTSSLVPLIRMSSSAECLGAATLAATWGSQRLRLGAAAHAVP